MKNIMFSFLLLAAGCSKPVDSIEIKDFTSAKKAMTEIGQFITIYHESQNGPGKIISPEKLRALVKEDPQVSKYANIFNDIVFRFKGGEDWQELNGAKALLMSAPKYKIRYYGGGICLPEKEGGNIELDKEAK